MYFKLKLMKKENITKIDKIGWRTYSILYYIGLPYFMSLIHIHILTSDNPN